MVANVAGVRRDTIELSIVCVLCVCVLSDACGCVCGACVCVNVCVNVCVFGRWVISWYTRGRTFGTHFLFPVLVTNIGLYLFPSSFLLPSFSLPSSLLTTFAS